MSQPLQLRLRAEAGNIHPKLQLGGGHTSEYDVPDSTLATVTFEAVTAAEASNDRDSLHEIIGQAFDRLGASVYVGVEARAALDGPKVRVNFGRTSPEWEAHYFAAGHAAHDPMVKHMLTSPDPLYWSDLTSGDHALSSRERRVFDEARSFGFSEGLAAPLHHPGGGVSAVLLMGEGLDGRDPAQRQAGQILSHAFSRAARRLRLAEERAVSDKPRLTRREAEALYWVSKGASDKTTAIAMALSPHTVAGYLRSAQEKLGAVGRIAVAQLAAELGLLPSYLPRAA